LDFNGILTRAHKRFDAQVGFDVLKKHFHVPPFLVQLSNGGGCPLFVVG
jgi:hypothetical protein